MGKPLKKPYAIKVLNKLVLMQLLVRARHKRTFHCYMINCHGVVKEAESFQGKGLNGQAK